jgi:hypothetical protein
MRLVDGADRGKAVRHQLQSAVHFFISRNKWVNCSLHHLKWRRCHLAVLVCKSENDLRLWKKGVLVFVWELASESFAVQNNRHGDQWTTFLHGLSVGWRLKTATMLRWDIEMHKSSGCESGYWRALGTSWRWTQLYRERLSSNSARWNHAKNVKKLMY